MHDACVQHLPTSHEHDSIILEAVMITVWSFLHDEKRKVLLEQFKIEITIKTWQ